MCRLSQSCAYSLGGWWGGCGRMMDKLTSLRLSRITLPEMSSEALWNIKAIKVTWVPQNALCILWERTQSQHAYMDHLQRKWTKNIMTGSIWIRSHSFLWHTSRFTSTLLFCRRTSQILIDSFTNIEWWETAVMNWQAQRGHPQMAAMTQRCRLFCSDSLQMPPGREAKINIICIVTGVQ